MPDAKILRTVITPAGDNDLVQLEISDGLLVAELESMEGSIRLSLEAKVRGYKYPALSHIQLEAVDRTLKALQSISTALGKEIAGSGYGTQLAPRNPRRDDSLN
jgi:hypothetical protein